MTTLAIQSNRQKGSARANGARIVAVVAACLLVSFLIVQETRAAFTAQTDNPNNSFNTTEIRLVDDDGGSTALFNATDMAPGDSVTDCIVVTYDGDISGAGTLTAVKMFGSTSTVGGLADELEVSVRTGTGGSFGDCSGFTPSGTSYGPAVLSGMPGDFATSTWDMFTPTTAGDDATVEVTVELPATATNGSMDESADATFTWEVQTTP